MKYVNWLHNLLVTYLRKEKSLEEIFEEVQSEKLCLLELDECSRFERLDDLIRIDVFLELLGRLMVLELYESGCEICR